MRVVVALGGNALQRRGEPMTVERERANVRVACLAMAPLAMEHELVISHGNGPQVGLLALQASAYDQESTYPFDVLGAQTEGMIGYLIEQELGNLLPFDKQLATVLTMVEVDPDDPAMADPTKFVGPVYTEADARRLAAETGLDRQGGRRRVATRGALARSATHLRDRADPDAARERRRGDLHRRRRDPDHVPAGGSVRTGGSQPAHAGGRRGGHRQGPGFGAARRRASMRTSWWSRRTPTPSTSTGGRRRSGRSGRPHLRSWRQFGFPEGSMGPKVEAAVAFAASAPGRVAVIGALGDLPEMLAGTRGTRISQDVLDLLLA